MKKSKNHALTPVQQRNAPSLINNNIYIRIKLYISGSKEFACIDLPKNQKFENLVGIVSILYNYDRSSIQLFYNKIPIENFYGKTLEQANSSGEIQLILIFSKIKKISSFAVKLSPSPSIHKESLNKQSSKKNVNYMTMYSQESEQKDNLSILPTNSPRYKSDRSQGKSYSLNDENSSNIKSIRLTTASNASNPTFHQVKKSDYLIKKDLDNLKKEFGLIEHNNRNLENMSNQETTSIVEKLENDFIRDSNTIGLSIKEIREKLDFRRNKIVNQMYNSKEKSKQQISEYEDNFHGLVKRINQFKEESIIGQKIFNEFYTKLNLIDYENINFGHVSNQIKSLWQITSDLNSQYSCIAKEMAEFNKLRYEHTNEYINLFQKINTLLAKDIEDLELKPKNSYEVISAMNKETCVLSIQENSNILYVYNKSQGVVKKTLSFNEISEKIKCFFWNCRIVQIKNSLYVTGGHDSSNNSVKTVLYYFDNNLTELKNMNYSHWGHSLSYIHQNYIIVISGYFTKKCEYYDIRKTTWSNLSEINYWRMDSTIFLFDNKYVYVFGGWNNFYKTSHDKRNNYVDKIEKIKILNNDSSQICNNNKWEILIVSNQKEKLLLNEMRKCSMGIIAIAVDKFYLIGGDNSDYNAESFEDFNYSGIGASKIKFHNSIMEVKINCIGGCEIEIKKFLLERPSSFSLNKNFQRLNKDEYGCFNKTNQFCQITVKGKDHFDNYYLN